MRKIIQIAVDPANQDNETTVLYALCDDGTLWAKHAGAERWTNEDATFPKAKPQGGLHGPESVL